MGDKPVEKHDLDVSKSQFEVLGVVPSNTRDSASNQGESKSTLDKLKEKVSKITHHRKKSSDKPEASIEESGTLHMNSNSGKPLLERHISSIPQKDDNLDPAQPGASVLTPSLEKTISQLPVDDYDSESEGKSSKMPPEKHDSGTAGSDFEVGGLMHIKSDDSGKKSPELKKPELERHISSIPQRDDEDKIEERPKRMSKLERTISKVPVDDFDSDGEKAL